MNRVQDEKAAAARARMGELAVKFTERTRGELVVMRERLAAAGAGDAAALGDIRHLAHRICGTGATLGFEDLAERAHEIESLAAAQSPATPPDAATLAGLARAVDALAAALAPAP
jgi:HPt (histidine-containing phosphotransfer) domain-containing protein